MILAREHEQETLQSVSHARFIERAYQYRRIKSDKREYDAPDKN